MKDLEINALIEPILRDKLGKVFDHSDVQSGIDHDGDPVLYVTITYKSGETAPELGPAILGVLSALSSRGETRIPLLRPRYPDDELGSSDEDTAPSVQ